MNLISKQTQILLPGLGLKADAEFDSFYSGAVNAHIQQAIEGINEQFSCIYLFGASLNGKSHLLQAACNLVTRGGGIGVYLPLAELLDYPAASVLEGIEAVELVAIDDVHLLQGRADWQEAIFNLYNYRLDNKRSMLFSANVPAVDLPIELADLRSRFTACVAYQLRSLCDQEKYQMLMFLAERYGMALNQQCANYILQHYGRSNAELVEMMAILAEATLLEKRRITVPFIKQQLSHAL